MNVVLDSNIYASDYRMESIPFRNLFDYLRKTSSSLVLFRIVREEVVARYARELKKRYKDAAKPWNAYRHLIFPEKPNLLGKPDLAEQKKQLRRRLMKPLKGINVVYEGHTPNISIDEVYLRGIHRIRPANADGEELRDVILWFAALAHAKETRGSVAFISDDSGFWQGNDVHPEIQKDVSTQGVSIRLYRGIEQFVEANFPMARPATAEWFSALLPLESVKTLISEAAAKEFQGRAQATFPFQRPTIRAADLTSWEFREGKIYEVAPNAQFADVTLAVEILVNTITVQTEMWVTTTRPPGQPGAVAMNILSPPVYGGYLNNILSLPVNQPQTVQAVDARHVCRGSPKVSLRITDGAVSEAQVSSFEIEQIEKIMEAETNA